MLKLDNKYIEKLEYIGCGGFGRLYRDGNLVYKIYKEKVRSSFCTYISNPSLMYSRLKINKLLSVDKKLIYTDLIKDTIFIDGKFSGVVVPYYDGVTLDNLSDLSYKNKIDLCVQIVRNARELTDNYIYPMDYKLDNIMFASGKIKLIDLDDVLTRVCHVYHRGIYKKSINNLDSTIKDFLNEFHLFPSMYLMGQIANVHSSKNNTYDEINSYLCRKKIRYPYVIISDNTDLFSNIRLFTDSRVRVIYTCKACKGFSELCKKLDVFNNNGVSIYDVVLERNLDKFLKNTLYSKIICAEEDKLQEKKLYYKKQ